MRRAWVWICLAAAGGAAAQDSPVTREGRYWVQTSEGSLSSPGLVRLRVGSIGDISVRGEATDQIRYTARRRVRANSEADARRLLQRAQVRLLRRGPQANLEVDPLDCGRCSFFAELKITAPRSTEELILETHGGSLEAFDLDGRVMGQTAGGAIQMDRIGKSVRAVTAGGPIQLGTIGGPVRCETAGGSITLGSVRGDAVLTTSGGNIDADQVDGTLRAETAGGSIRVRRASRSVNAETAGGSIYLGQIGGGVTAETAGGSITIESASGGVRAENANGSIKLIDVSGPVRAATAAGNILAQLMASGPVADSLLETSMGNIVVLIPDSLRLTIRADVEVASSVNRIQSDFPAVQVRLADQGPGPRAVVAEGALNGGGPVLRIRNTAGTIQIKRR
jgi:hypothetical protein